MVNCAVYCLEIMCFRLSFSLGISFCTRFSVFLSPFISSSFPYQPCTIHMANIMTVLYSVHQNCSQHNTDSSKQTAQTAAAAIHVSALMDDTSLDGKSATNNYIRASHGDLTTGAHRMVQIS